MSKGGNCGEMMASAPDPLDEGGDYPPALLDDARVPLILDVSLAVLIVVVVLIEVLSPRLL